MVVAEPYSGTADGVKFAILGVGFVSIDAGGLLIQPTDAGFLYLVCWLF